MTTIPKYTPHQKISLRKHPTLNEAWLHERICEDPTILGLGDVRVLDRERQLTGGGRLDLLLLDDENNRRYEVEIQLGATDPSHIVRAIEYWDLERRRYPAYEHIAVIVAEDITSRFLNVMALLSGSIPMIAIQLDALQVADHLLLNFVQVLDLTELRADDVEDDESGGGAVDRSYWEARAGKTLMGICDDMLDLVRRHAKSPTEFNYLRGYMGLRSNGVVRNVLAMSPKPTKNYVNVYFRVGDAAEWKERFEEAGVPVQSKRKNRFALKLTPEDYERHRALIEEAVAARWKRRESDRDHSLFSRNARYERPSRRGGRRAGPRRIPEEAGGSLAIIDSSDASSTGSRRDAPGRPPAAPKARPSAGASSRSKKSRKPFWSGPICTSTRWSKPASTYGRIRSTCCSTSGPSATASSRSSERTERAAAAKAFGVGSSGSTCQPRPLQRAKRWAVSRACSSRGAQHSATSA